MKHKDVAYIMECSEEKVTRWVKAKSPTVRRPNRAGIVDPETAKQLCLKKRFASAERATAEFINPKTGNFEAGGPIDGV